MISINKNYFVSYKVVITDDNVHFKYCCYLRYNILSFKKIDDLIEIDENFSFKDAKRLMFTTIKAFNKLIN